MKINMYQNVPEEFHDQLMRTLEGLPEGREQQTVKHTNFRKWAVLAAAAVMALGALTVTASEIFKWQKQAKERFGVSDDLEDELILNGVAREENAVIQAQGVEFRLLQSVRTGSSCYYLCQLTLPEGIEPDEDTVFEKIDAEADVELNGLTADLVCDSQERDRIFVEIEILLAEGVDYEGQDVTVHMSNLVQTRKTEIVGTLLEGDWEVPVTLPGQTQSVIYEAGQRITLGEHELLIRKIQAEPFELRLYMEQEESVHAMMYYPVTLTGIRNADGSLTEEDSFLNRFGHTDEATGEFYYQATLEQAVDPAKIAGIVFNDGEAELGFLAGAISYGADADETASGYSGKEIDLTVSDEKMPEKTDTLYRKNGYEIVTDGKGLYIHDISCKKVTMVLNLETLKYDREKGGEIVPFNTDMAYILPFEGSDTVYIYGMTADEEGEHILSAMPAEETLESDSYQIFRGYMLEERDGAKE